jgi:DNA-binding beta-propeller fold protein YncE
VTKTRVVPNSLVRIDARTYEIVEVVPVGRSPQKVAAQGEFVWVVNGKDETLTRVATSDGRAETVGGLRLKQPAGLTADGGRGLWVGSFEESDLVRVDPVTLAILEQAEGTVSRIDPGTNGVVETSSGSILMVSWLQAELSGSRSPRD